MAVEHQTLKRIHEPLSFAYGSKLFKGQSRAKETEVARKRTKFGLRVSYRLCHVAQSLCFPFQTFVTDPKIQFSSETQLNSTCRPICTAPSGHRGGPLLLVTVWLAFKHVCSCDILNHCPESPQWLQLTFLFLPVWLVFCRQTVLPLACLCGLASPLPLCLTTPLVHCPEKARPLMVNTGRANKGEFFWLSRVFGGVFVGSFGLFLSSSYFLSLSFLFFHYFFSFFFF